MVKFSLLGNTRYALELANLSISIVSIIFETDGYPLVKEEWSS